jgi:putative component of toxin-antitoxin plasmid stabilization module
MHTHHYQIHRIPEFRDWFNTQTEKAKVQIDDRLSKIQDEGYFGDHKSVCDYDEVLELKWKNGRRVYFS